MRRLMSSVKTGKSVGEMIAILIVALAIIAGIVWISMTIWNNIMPLIFGLPQITFWQTWGLWWLGDFFFGGTGKSSE